MTWVRLDDHFAEDDAVADLTDRAFRLHIIALCYCGRNLTDGRLDARAVRVTGAVLTAGRPVRWVKELADAGLWIDNGDGSYEIKNFLDFNPPEAQVKEERKKARERMRDLRARRSSSRSAEHSGEHSDARSATPTRPDPTELEKPDVSTGIEPTIAELANRCPDANKRTIDNLTKEAQGLDESFVTALLEKANGRRGAGYFVNAMRAERLRLMAAGVEFLEP